MLPIIEEKLKLLPDRPGCYQMRDKGNTVIYVGKAKNLKNRVRSYFHGAHNAKTTKLVSEIADFTYVITASELEAFVLEINMIKEYDPKYNIMLKDDKTYPYIALTNEENPRLIVTRNQKKRNFARYFGPYPNVHAARTTIDVLNQIYPFRKCYNIPKKECLYYHMHQCLGPCINKEKLDYSNYKTKVSSFLNGDAKEVLDDITSRMQEASENLEFEKAKEYRDLKFAIEDTVAKQKISINDLTSRDYIGIYTDEDDISINIIITRHGNIVQNHQTIINKYDSLEDETINYLIQFYEVNSKPKEICFKAFDAELLASALDVNIYEAKLGKKKEILDMANDNAKFNLENKRNIYRNQVLKKLETIEELGNLLGVPTPRRIEAFDNSNLYGEYPVSAMVCYINGKPAPKEFRKYHIKTVKGANDYESMKEVIYRRYFRLMMEEGDFPDLIVMDGGEIQVHAALDVLESLNLSIPVMGIQKNDRHKASKIFFEETLFELDKNSPIYLLLADISQRVHDFAISFFRSNKAKGLFSSMLDPIPGLGPKRKEQLLTYFVSIDHIKEASVEDLKASGMPDALAHSIYKYFCKQKEEKK
ncbi:MAG: excinuclease ABC subunit UvrC [Roseburia sp.]|nr:excinuclease ABC subunit UvrC [Anaeroplasma bactoclasticum]MCM1196304.1 excinuclease ABC subunit UvrC [Roseburia sp.]MCM1557174.1 excinuclease ABC subunit UvrC [Anaeroplasma bactoclasticum]